MLVETGHKISDVVNPDLNKLDLNPAVMMMMFSLPPCGLDVCSCDRSAAICLVVSLVASIFMSDQTLGSNQTSAINSPTLKKHQFHRCSRLQLPLCSASLITRLEHVEKSSATDSNCVHAQTEFLQKYAGSLSRSLDQRIIHIPAHWVPKISD